MPPIPLQPVVPAPAPTFSKLPLELCVQVAKYLDAPSVARLAQTSRHFATVSQDNQVWASLSLRRFGSRSVDAATASDIHEHDHRAAFKQLLLANPLNCPAERLRIIWLTPNTHWWTLTAAPATNSRSPVVAQLNVVHWFDVRSTTAGVPRGEYTPTFRLRFLRNAHTSLDHVALRAWVQTDSPSHEQYVPNSGDAQDPTISSRVEEALGQLLEPLRVDQPMGFFVARSLPENWIDIRLPQIKVDSEYASVIMEMTDHSTARPKRGLQIDCFELVSNTAVSDTALEERQVHLQGQELKEQQETSDNNDLASPSLELPDTVINGLRIGGASIAGAVRYLAGL
ncbi:hypothetical protein HDU87_007655 [Geranomyces variabilis]|uniref:F-box domain-containing protein n=1 Tax=Geranomyces variabilis TaxID=109894 RepID=A0AAD5XMN4_9FUNG|nr:hypothetical protein HDU87_007655 [Geranomyces variabilis]